LAKTLSRNFLHGLTPRTGLRWGLLLVTYLILLLGTGYVAFFHEATNPALVIDENIDR
jgi:hypothetical protein